MLECHQTHWRRKGVATLAISVTRASNNAREAGADLQPDQVEENGAKKMQESLHVQNNVSITDTHQK